MSIYIEQGYNWVLKSNLKLIFFWGEYICNSIPNSILIKFNEYLYPSQIENEHTMMLTFIIVCRKEAKFSKITQLEKEDVYI